MRLTMKNDFLWGRLEEDEERRVIKITIGKSQFISKRGCSENSEQPLFD